MTHSRRRPGPRGPRLFDQAPRTLPTALVREMTEAEFLDNVVDLARSFGWLVNHVYPALTPGGTWLTPTTYRGFPDLTLLRRGEAIFLELKAVGGEATPEQLRWIALAQTVPGVDAWVVDPRDWPEVHARLTRPRPPRT